MVVLRALTLFLAIVLIGGVLGWLWWLIEGDRKPKKPVVIAPEPVKRVVRRKDAVIGVGKKMTVYQSDEKWPDNAEWVVLLDQPLTKAQAEEIQRRFEGVYGSDIVRPIVKEVVEGSSEADGGATDPVPGGLLPSDRRWISDQLRRSGPDFKR